MADWRSRLRYDPVKPLLEADNGAIACFTCRDLLDEEVPPAGFVWGLPEVRKILRRQQPDGSWKPASGKQEKCPGVKYPLIETYRHLRHLVDQYEIDRRHPAIAKAAEYVFSCQTDEGDIRGILAGQYAPYYTGALMSLLIKAGYADDPRIEKGFRWLLDMRQDDGGWVIGSPGMIGLADRSVKNVNDLTSNAARETARAFDRSRPFSAAGTGMVLRAFAAHPRWRASAEARAAAGLLKSKFLREDNWSSYRHPDNWVRFQYPFWWTNLVSALDTLSLIGVPIDDPDISRALRWLAEHQRPDGLWETSYSAIHKNSENRQSQEMRLWITLAICRIFKRYGHC
ncbi:MAG: Prenyltransferase and squalene oxidase repeat protein [Methanocella sp. PtaU1.Bin125]|nr:MAG: Prenyltransferase and squalene oxidase repeat protein [Methanocella sp. PtaU1.Bin125]